MSIILDMTDYARRARSWGATQIERGEIRGKWHDTLALVERQCKAANGDQDQLADLHIVVNMLVRDIEAATGKPANHPMWGALTARLEKAKALLSGQTAEVRP